MKTFVLAAAAALVLAGCSSHNQPQAAPSPTPTGPPVAQRYGTVVALKDAAVQAGFTCPKWVQDNVVQDSAESGHCADDDVFSTYATSADLQTGADNIKGMNQMMRDNHLDPGVVLVGPNWIINAPDPDVTRLVKKLGGTVER